MTTYFEPDPSDKRDDSIDQRCANCSDRFYDHYNGKCPTSEITAPRSPE